MTSVLPQKRSFRLQLATLMMIGIVGVAGIIAVAWFAGQGTITTIFNQLYALQQHPPMWAMTPMMVGEYFLFWTVALMVVVLVIMKVWPSPTTWPRRIVVGILAILTIRYLLWRSVSTLNLSTPLNGVFSLGLF
ncbi:MAG: cellulose synthase catalytic subunit, partial [Cyanobacteria bacterium P01_A01_bin.114]